MTKTDAALLAALGDCLESGDTLPQAIGKIEMAGAEARSWAALVRRTVKPEPPFAGALRASGLFGEDERSLLPTDGAGAEVALPLQAVALRRRRAATRRRAIRLGLLGPFAFAALTVILDPLPNLVTDEPFVWPVVRGLLVLCVLTFAIVAGMPALLRSARTRNRLLRACSAVPGIGWFAAQHAEEELATALAAYVENDAVTPAGLGAAASLLSWSALGGVLGTTATLARPAAAPLAMGGLEPAARHLSLATNLAIVGGVASRRLAERLRLRADAIEVVLTSRLRLAVRVAAYILVVVLSVSSLVGMISRGLPGMPMLPGGSVSPDQQQLEDLLKQLDK
jgi:hypothetical protein